MNFRAKRVLMIINVQLMEISVKKTRGARKIDVNIPRDY